ncbi:MAG: hypothetical protein K6E61_03380 [Bacteroidales bacterium]|nr:hypothetical protein [Bacteroidales bacterium]
MSTRQGNLKDYQGNKIAPNTCSAAVLDEARNRGLSASLQVLVERNALGYPAFTTVSAYSVGDKVFYDRKLWKFIADHAAGDWNSAEVEEYSLEEAIGELKAAIENGGVTAALADNLTSWNDRGNLSVEDTFSEQVQTTAGDNSIDSSAGAILIGLVPKETFYASALRASGFNLLRNAASVGDGYYFLVPALPFGAFGSAEKPNGILFTNSAGENLTPTVRFKALSSGVPESVSDGVECPYTNSNGYRFYNPTGIGYLIVSGITYGTTCAHIGWSRRYDEYIAPDAAGDAGSSVSLSSIINTVHAFGKLLVVGNSVDFLERYSSTQVMWTRACDRVAPTWTTTPDEVEEGETQTYTHQATISGMKPGSVVKCGNLSLAVEGTTVSYTDESATATSEYLYYELATVVTGLVTLDTQMAIEDWGLVYLDGVIGSADVTMRYAQGYPDTVAALVNGGIDKKMEPLEEAIADNTEHIRALESNAFGQDLSFIDSKTGKPLLLRSTANSYIVRNAGVYRIPLVYGNGIDKGEVNAKAYTRQGSTYTADFVNHLGNAIESPYIEKNAGCAAGSAALLWQTAQGMISSVGISEGVDCKYLTFTVASVPATNGTAVLCVKDENGDIMWSWAIWMTVDDIEPVVITNYTGVKYNLMGVPFGAIWNVDHTRYVVPFFQWGRKDLLGYAAAYNSTSAMTLYDISGNSVSIGTYGVADDSDAGGTVRSVANAIKMPDKFFLEYDATNYNWNNLAWFNNFWNAAETTSSSLADDQATHIKTIYDPTPNGWSVPAGRFATGFTSTGSNTSTAEQFNVIGSFDAGWKFKKNSGDTEGIFFPASGYRNRTSGGLYSVGSGGYWWAFAPSSQTSARGLLFGSGYVHPLNDNYRALGFGVWPVRE